MKFLHKYVKKKLTNRFHEMKFVTELKEHNWETPKIVAGPVWNTGPKYPPVPCKAG